MGRFKGRQMMLRNWSMFEIVPDVDTRYITYFTNGVGGDNKSDLILYNMTNCLVIFYINTKVI